MRRNLLFSENIMSESTHSSLYKTTLPAGDYHVHSEGGKLCVADDRWGVLAFILATNTEAEFHLDKQMALNIQAQDKTTCRNVAIESKPAYDIFVFGGGASKLLHRADRAILSLRMVVGCEDRESMHRPQGAQGADYVGRHVAHRHQGGEWLANRLRRQRGPIAGERRNHGNGCFRTGRWNNPVSTGESFLRGFGFQGGTGLAAMLESRTVGGEDHGLRLLHRGDGTLLNGLGVAA